MHLAKRPLNEVITCTKDLEYVNQKLLASGFCDIGFHTVGCGKSYPASRPTASESPQSPIVLHSGLSRRSSLSDHDRSVAPKPTSPSIPSESFDQRRKVLDPTSPESKARCTSEDCPLKGIEHNVGKYFHDGDQATETLPRGISQAFNNTTPPPHIVAAWERMTNDAASQSDKDQVRQYQKHHMWSPINSESSSPTDPIPKRMFCVRHANIADCEDSNISRCVRKAPARNSLRNQAGSPRFAEPTTPNRTSNSEAPADKDGIYKRDDTHGFKKESGSLQNLKAGIGRMRRFLLT